MSWVIGPGFKWFRLGPTDPPSKSRRRSRGFKTIVLQVPGCRDDLPNLCWRADPTAVAQAEELLSAYSD